MQKKKKNHKNSYTQNKPRKDTRNIISFGDKILKCVKSTLYVVLDGYK